MRRGDKQRARRRRRCASGPSKVNPLSYWRRFPAEAFNAPLRGALARSIRSIGSTLPEWQAAIAGDAGAAVGIVLRLRAPFRVTARTDLAMTLLLNCAFANAGAALVLSHALRRMQFARVERKRLAESWLVHHGQLAQHRGTRRSSGDRSSSRRPSRLEARARAKRDDVRPAHENWEGPDDAA
ncbi:hypothetical protein [Bradyrhizobium sp. WSM1743]|uniref:hypothetical protein n=1 Tax=Bradyrhizobium sp. WSM1743 TaxID=318996 RepID=UPI000405B276|nr:hypothetical protein [Bradyrhizobium sp. WSM1743]